MKMPKVNRQIALATGVIVAGSIAGVVALSSPQPTGATDSPLTTQVANQQQELDNHEARITNTENDVKDLQNNTGTAPSTNRVAVPSYTPTSSTSTSISTITADPVVVTAYEKIVIDSLTTDCKYTYSDGTTYQFDWQVINPQGSWQTDGNGLNGHWVATTATSGKCDSSVIGQAKT